MGNFYYSRSCVENLIVIWLFFFLIRLPLSCEAGRHFTTQCKCSLTHCIAPGLYSNDPLVNAYLGNHCRFEHVNIRHICDCLKNLISGTTIENQKSDHELFGKKLIDPILSMSYWPFIKDTQTFNSIKATNPSAEQLISNQMCHCRDDNPKGTQDRPRQPELAQSSDRTSTINFAVNTNLPILSHLNDDQGPAVNPAKGVFLFGYYNNPHKESVNIYYIVRNLVQHTGVKSTCKCERNIIQHPPFAVLIFSCLIPESGCDISILESTVTISHIESSRHCNNDHVFVRSKNILPTRMETNSPIVHYVLCMNGTIMQETLHMFDLGRNTLCKSFSLYDTYLQCLGDIIHNDKCVISEPKLINNKYTVTIKTDLNGKIHVYLDGDIDDIDCFQTCDIAFANKYKRIIITCPNGYSREFTESKVTHECPLLDKYLFERAAIYACRASFRPNLVWTLLVFTIIGYHVVAIGLFLLDGLSYITGCIYRAVKQKYKSKLTDCTHCGDQVPFDGLVKRHLKCKDNICPYCRNTMKQLVEHVLQCPYKASILERESTDQLEDKFTKFTRGFWNRNHYSSPINKLIYGITILILFIIIIIPIEGQELSHYNPYDELNYGNFNNYVRGYWTRIRDETCGKNCFHNSISCICLDTNLINDESSPSEPDFLHPPKGFFHLHSNYKPALSDRNIDLTFSIRSEVAGKVFITGNTDTIMELEEDTGIVWVIGAENVEEKAKVSLSIHRYGQIYKSKFNYWMVDRKVFNGVGNACTGDCPRSCGCKSKTCKVFIKENIRGWSCNPTWCWNFAGGCSCCYTKADIVDPKYLIGEFEMEYLATEISICLKRSHDEFTCKVMSHNDRMDVNGIEVKVSKVFNVDKKLPKKIHVYYELDGKHFDVSKPKGILIDADICAMTNCRHGEVGDFRFGNLKNMLFEPGQTRNEENLFMVWDGIQQSIDCVSFHWPTCNAFGAVESTTKMFKNLIDTTSRVGLDFHILQSQIRLDNDYYPDLQLVVAPKKNAGSVQIFMTVKNFALHKAAVKPLLHSFKIHWCSGCKDCYTGFSCEISMSLSEPNEYYLHLFSSDSLVMLEDQAIRATTVETRHNVTLFSSVSINSVKLCVKEVDRCAEYKNINLTKPIKKISSDKKLIKKQETDKGGFSLEGVGSFLGNFFVNIWGFISELFKSRVVLIIIFVIILIVVIKVILPYLPRFGNRFREKRDFSKEV